MKAARRILYLVPWHIGDLLDVTLNAARAARELRVFLAEEPDVTRAQFERLLGADCGGKLFLRVPEAEDERFLAEARALLGREDVALISSGGAPCFIDPGAWLVRRLRDEGFPVVAMAGASVFSTMLSLSGVEWTAGGGRGSFALFDGRGPREEFLEAVARAAEPVFVFLPVGRFADCMRAMEPAVGRRLVTAFFDLTKVPPAKFPYANRTQTMDCGDWLREAGSIEWVSVSDVALMVHPAPGPAGRRK